ncbi:MAG: GNAT family N-acetyltransferase, partial [Ilumatobacter sp.]
MRIRSAEEDELAQLSDLALRSKAVHGYSEEFLEACREELTITPHRLANETILVAEQSGRRLGFVAVAVHHDRAELMDLFVEPGRR